VDAWIDWIVVAGKPAGLGGHFGADLADRPGAGGRPEGRCVVAGKPWHCTGKPAGAGIRLASG